MGTVLLKSTAVPVLGTLKKYRDTGTRYFDQKYRGTLGGTF